MRPRIAPNDERLSRLIAGGTPMDFSRNTDEFVRLFSLHTLAVTHHVPCPPKQDTPNAVAGYGFGSAHTSGPNMALCDGSVRSVSYSIDPEVHRRLDNRQDGLPIDVNPF
jgi:prepilin-type processing-associated H-X9-DG protein